MLPISDTTIFNKALSSLTSYVTNKAIKLKLPGELAVLNPSGQRMKVFDVYDENGNKTTVKLSAFDMSD
jgi:hypothetical protein